MNLGTTGDDGRARKKMKRSPNILFYPLPITHEEFPKSLFTYVLTVDSSKTSSIDSQLKTHCSILVKEKGGLKI